MTERNVAALHLSHPPTTHAVPPVQNDSLPHMVHHLLSSPRMSERDKKPADQKSTEEQLEKIEVIEGTEVLGYEGSGREEHSGQNEPEPSDGLTDDLADNWPGASKTET